MAVATSGADTGGTGRGPSLSNLLLPIGGIIGLIIVAIGLMFLADQHGAQNLLGSLFDLIGNPEAAAGVRNGTSDQLLAKMILAVVALAAGVGGIWLLYAGLSALVGLFGPKVQERVIPWVFVVPAVLLLAGYLVYPSMVTVLTSFESKSGAFTLDVWTGLFKQPIGDVIAKNIVFIVALDVAAILVGFAIAWIYRRRTGDSLKKRWIVAPLGIAIAWEALQTPGVFSSDIGITLTNNVLWLVIGTGGAVVLGLVIAAMFDRIRRESLAKTFVFLPLAISLVGASVIWTFVYAWRPPGSPQYGLLNAVWTGLGGQPIDWIHTVPINTYLLIIIFIWLQTGFAMVVLSAAIKGVSTEVLEAARLDGASERQIFFRVIVPIIKGSILAVITTIAIADLKVFDIVYVTTGGRFNTDVVANRMFVEAFQFFNDGRGAALATILFIGVLPVMYINLRNLREQGVGS
jgi:alpha-glucoside transport system permease protein